MNNTMSESMPRCCIDFAESNFRARFPLEPPLEQDWLLDFLSNLSKKWGKVTEKATKGIFIRTVPRQDFFDARTSSLTCPNGHEIRTVLIGSRVYYLTWRINLICLTYWENISREDARFVVTGGNNWPKPVHVEQLKTALDVYLNDAFLSNRGFEDLKRFVVDSAAAVNINQMYIGEFALLFLFLHEIMHAIEDDLGPEKPIRYKIKAGGDELSEARKGRWNAELSHDANAAFTAYVSAAEVFCKTFKLRKDEALAQAGSLVYPGVDLALHTLQFVEECRIGPVKYEDAVYMQEFTKHPPTQFRRDKLSHTAYNAITGNPIEDLWKGKVTEAWKMVAENTVSQMRLRDRLFAAYQKGKTYQ